jgi:hypothetical protein
MWPVSLAGNGGATFLIPVGQPVVQELSPKDLSVQQPLSGGGVFSLVCSETNVTCTALDNTGQPLPWAWDLVGGSQQTAVVQTVSSNAVTYSYGGASYQLRLSSGSCQTLGDGSLRLSPNAAGTLVLILDIRE